MLIAAVIAAGAAGAGLLQSAAFASASAPPAVSDHRPAAASDGSSRPPATDRLAAEEDTASDGIAAVIAPPGVTAVTIGSHEGGVGSVRASVIDLGAGALSAQIEWGDGTPAQPISIDQLAAGVDHAYGDDGDYPVVVTVTDGDGAVGAHAVAMRIANVDPAVTLTAQDATTLPGGERAVVRAGRATAFMARAVDPGSDDLVFTWSNGRGRTFLRDASGHDAPLSPAGVVPVSAETRTEVPTVQPGVESLQVTVADDDGGQTSATVRVLVTGTDAATRSRSLWIQQLSGVDATGLGPDTAEAYLDVVESASAVFSGGVATATDAVAVLSPRADDPAAQARAELLCAWLQFASGAVSWDSAVTAADDGSTFARLITAAETAIASRATTDAVLREISADLSRVSNPGE